MRRKSLKKNSKERIILVHYLGDDGVWSFKLCSRDKIEEIKLGLEFVNVKEVEIPLLEYEKKYLEEE